LSGAESHTIQMVGLEHYSRDRKPWVATASAGK